MSKPTRKYEHGPINAAPLIEIVGSEYEERQLPGAKKKGWHYLVVRDGKDKWMSEEAITKMLKELE